MDWLQILSLFLANAGLVVWFRSESRNDWRHMDAKIDSIREEMKDFHTRLALQDKDFKTTLAMQDLEYKTKLLEMEQRLQTKNEINKKPSVPNLKTNVTKNEGYL